MSDFEHQRIATDPVIDRFAPNPVINARQAVYAIQKMDAAHLGHIRYSSPRPWVLALGISLTMWGGIGWLTWAYFK